MKRKYYKNHLHYFYSCRKMIEKRFKWGRNNNDEKLFNATTSIYDFSIEYEELIAEKCLRPPYEIFTYRIVNSKDDETLLHVVENFELIIMDYKQMFNMDKAQIVSSLYYLENYVDKYKLSVANYITTRWFKSFGNYISFSDTALKELEQIINKSGVYKLYDINKELIYLGKSYTLGHRIISSANERDAFYYAYVIIDNKADTDIYEIYYITTIQPKLNAENKHGDVPTIKLPDLIFTEPKPLFDEVIIQEVKKDRDTMKTLKQN